MQYCPTTHLTLHFACLDALLDWHSISRHEVTCGFNLIPFFGVQFLQETEKVIKDVVLLIKLIIMRIKVEILPGEHS